MDPREQFLDTWSINNRLNLFLLDAVPPELLGTPLQKGKSVEGQFAHIHNVRLMWLKAAAPDLNESQQKLESPGRSIEEIHAALTSSGEAMAAMLARSWDAGGKVKGFKPHVCAFLGYLISHEANHRGHVELALRQAGSPLSDKVSYGIWEWGAR